MKEIKLTNGMVTQVSDHRFEYLSQWNWRAERRGGTWYARRVTWKDRFYLHRFIMGTTDTQTQVDHIDGNGLNNQDENLRTCTNAENSRNGKIRKRNKSGYKGVYKDSRGWDYYNAEIRANGKRYSLGCFKDPVEAAKAYDAAAKRLHGEFANLNFPEVKS